MVPKRAPGWLDALFKGSNILASKTPCPYFVVGRFLSDRPRLKSCTELLSELVSEQANPGLLIRLQP